MNDKMEDLPLSSSTSQRTLPVSIPTRKHKESEGAGILGHPHDHEHAQEGFGDDLLSYEEYIQRQKEIRTKLVQRQQHRRRSLPLPPPLAHHPLPTPSRFAGPSRPSHPDLKQMDFLPEEARLLKIFSSAPYGLAHSFSPDFQWQGHSPLARRQVPSLPFERTSTFHSGGGTKTPFDKAIRIGRADDLRCAGTDHKVVVPKRMTNVPMRPRRMDGPDVIVKAFGHTLTVRRRQKEDSVVQSSGESGEIGTGDVSTLSSGKRRNEAERRRRARRRRMERRKRSSQGRVKSQDVEISTKKRKTIEMDISSRSGLGNTKESDRKKIFLENETSDKDVDVDVDADVDDAFVDIRSRGSESEPDVSHHMEDPEMPNTVGRRRSHLSLFDSDDDGGDHENADISPSTSLQATNTVPFKSPQEDNMSDSPSVHSDDNEEDIIVIPVSEEEEEEEEEDGWLEEQEKETSVQLAKQQKTLVKSEETSFENFREEPATLSQLKEREKDDESEESGSSQLYPVACKVVGVSATQMGMTSDSRMMMTSFIVDAPQFISLQRTYSREYVENVVKNMNARIQQQGLAIVHMDEYPLDTRKEMLSQFVVESTRFVQSVRNVMESMDVVQRIKSLVAFGEIYEESMLDQVFSGISFKMDIAGGLESVPIPAYDESGGSEISFGFKYIQRSTHAGKASDIVQRGMESFREYLLSCDDCLHHSSITNVKERNYDDSGRLLWITRHGTKEGFGGFVVHECNWKCRCARNPTACPNRVVQRGLHVNVAVVRMEKKGWGVIALKPIAMGEFVCDYVGEILTSGDADRRSCDSYFFQINSVERNVRHDGDGDEDEDDDGDGKQEEESSDIESFVIDAYRFGNVSRFVNHSCEANLISVPVCVEVSDETLHHVSLFAKRKICEGEELTLDYHYQINDRSMPCLCGAPNCRQWLR
eukprot:TRINITY_DN1569_c0_g1_i1.p1 TRINITY_DN1569_c0_g1~~TRINITY_DN1569_c0_g1_i1.p1  ORF type:complete len:931 (-),score=226.89 TRINITY_DN1569_c0_g1_i1:73-2865(-)